MSFAWDVVTLVLEQNVALKWTTELFSQRYPFVCDDLIGSLLGGIDCWHDGVVFAVACIGHFGFKTSAWHRTAGVTSWSDVIEIQVLLVCLILLLQSFIQHVWVIPDLEGFSTKAGSWWTKTTFWQLIEMKLRHKMGRLNRHVPCSKRRRLWADSDPTSRCSLLPESVSWTRYTALSERERVAPRWHAPPWQEAGLSGHRGPVWNPQEAAGTITH